MYREEWITRIAARLAAVAAYSVGLLGSVLAADLTGSEIKALLSGKTFYVETTAASAAGTPGQGIIYWGDDGSVLYKTPSSALWHGQSEIKGNTLCTTWKERPNTGCTRYDKTGDTVTIYDAASGQVRAKIVKIMPGNFEKLAP